MCEISKFLSLCFSFRGYAKALVFQDITEEDIRLVQEYVSNELPEHLETSLTENHLEYTPRQKACFFGSYVSAPTKFCFAPGERLMIMKMVRHVKEMVDKHGLQHYADENIVPKRNLFQISMIKSVFGLVYGFHEKLNIEKVNNLVIDTTQHQNVLFEKAKAAFLQFQKEDRQPKQEFTANMVEIKTEGDKIKGKVSCIFCEGKNLLSVFCKSSGNWVLTNLTSHLNKQHSKQDNDIVKRCEMLTINEEKANTVADNDDGARSNQSIAENQMSDILFTQISAQCIKMENTVSQYSEKTQSKRIKLATRKSVNVKYCPIPGDGNCLFSGIVHQLFNTSLVSVDHKQKTQILRKEVVSYIKEHLDEFIYNLKNRISSKNATDIAQACNAFLDDQLSMPGFWGGMESIKAISEIHKVNIIVMNEIGTSNLPNYFHSGANRSIMLLFGNANGKLCKNNAERTHYDSIVHISQEKITEIANELCNAEIKHEKFLKEVQSNEVILLE